MSLIGNCLNKLVKQGRIPAKAAADALKIHEGLQGRLYPTMPPTRADAAAALEAARMMAEGARQRKASLAQQALTLRAAEERVLAHPEGITAGVMALLTRDIHGKQGFNVDSHSEVIFGQLLGKARTLVETYKSRAAGLTQDIVGVRNAIREVFGKSTGDNLAIEAAAGWKAAVEAGVARMKQNGVKLAELEDWRVPQFWESFRVKGVPKDEFMNDVRREIDSGGLELVDKESMKVATPLQREAVLERAYADITANLYRPHNDVRVFRFKDAESYLRLMDKYGAGEGGIYGMMTSYLRSMSKEIALAEVLGNQHLASVRHFTDMAKKAEGSTIKATTVKLPFIGKKISIAPRKIFQARRLVESPAAIKRTYDYLTGRTNTVQGEYMSAIFGGLRSLKTAANLGSAVITAVPGDMATSAMAAAHVGMSPMRIIRGVFRDARSSPEMRRIAERMNIISHSIMDMSLGAKRFEDEISGVDALGRLASFIIRAQGLAAWTDMLKRVFVMEFMGHLGDASTKAFDDLDAPLRGFLQRYSILPGEWDKIRAAPLLEAEGAKFFDVEAIEDRQLAERLMGAVIDERHFAVIEPDARVRGATTMGFQRGTFAGEMIRSAFLFKSFGLSLLLTHMKRALQDGPWYLKAWRTSAFLATMTMAGGVAIEARSLLLGQDLRDPRDPSFAMDAFFYGGGAGIYGDFLHSATSRTGSTLLGQASGPIGQTLEDTFSGTAETIRRFRNGQDQKFGERLARFMASNLPGSNLWYSRLIADRYIFDQMQALLDPDYYRSFAREEERLRERTGQEFYWAPGELGPRRAPSIGLQ